MAGRLSRSVRFKMTAMHLDSRATAAANSDRRRLFSYFFALLYVALAIQSPRGVTATRHAPEPHYQIRVLSSRPEWVSGGDVLVEYDEPPHSPRTVWLNGKNVTNSFRQSLATPSAGRLALLRGLRIGANTLQLRSASGATLESLTLTNHPLTGPIFSGAPQTPFVCQTLPNGLGPPSDGDCSAKTVVSYYYKSSAPAIASPTGTATGETAGALGHGFKTYDPSATMPADIANTTTTDGRTIGYIVRREVGTINRAVYDIQFLYVPGEQLPTPWGSRYTGWNGRLVYTFGGGCSAGFHQGLLGAGIGTNNEPYISQGYATATATLNIFSNNCNDRLSLETTSMVKEHFVKTYGVPVHTIGAGESGGAMQAYLTVQNAPGLLDGILAARSFPDIMSFVQFTGDCLGLERAFDRSSLHWTEQQKAAVSGLATWHTCEIPRIYGILPFKPDRCDPALESQHHHSTLRCDIFENLVNVVGRDPRTGLAYSLYDNLGVLFGLSAFKAHLIDAEHLIDLNEHMGGFDGNGALVDSRAQADTGAVARAYNSGMMLTGYGMGNVPIVDWRPYSDEFGAADGHVEFLSNAIRARLIGANDTAANQAILIMPRESWFDVHGSGPFAADDLIQRMDQWLDQIAADDSTLPLASKVGRDRPRDLEDGCWTTDGERTREAVALEATGRCVQLYPPHVFPRVVAGAPTADDVLKCELKPLRQADFGELTAAQLEHLQAIFPQGVCDYTKPGVGQRSGAGESRACVGKPQDSLIRLSTTEGDVDIELYGAHAPITVCNFLRYVNGHAFDGGRFFRTVRPDNQVGRRAPIQIVQADWAADAHIFLPIPLERTSLTGIHHIDGTVSMARLATDDATASFSICIGDQPDLDYGGSRNPDGQGFAAFGRVIRGMEIVRRIWMAPADGERLLRPIKIDHAYRIQ